MSGTASAPQTREPPFRVRHMGSLPGPAALKVARADFEVGEPAGRGAKDGSAVSEARQWARPRRCVEVARGALGDA
jgi:hypothetical protein